MVIGTLRLVFSLEGNKSLKEKRRVVRRTLDRVRHRFNAAAAETECMDDHRRAVIGIAVVSNDHSHANAMLDTIASFAASDSLAPMVDRSTELVHVGARDEEFGRTMADAEADGGGAFDD